MACEAHFPRPGIARKSQDKVRGVRSGPRRRPPIGHQTYAELTFSEQARAGLARDLIIILVGHVHVTGIHNIEKGVGIMSMSKILSTICWDPLKHFKLQSERASPYLPRKLLRHPRTTASG